jgi:glycosyltransferase involved in cell wall biosynthesis
MQAPAADTWIDVTLIVPIHSVHAPISDVVAAFSRELDALGKRWELFLVFDGVRGQAHASATQIAQQFAGRVRILSFQQSFGDSVCLTAAFEQSRGKVIVTAPQYVQIDPHEITSLFRALDAGADFVTPLRQPRIDPWLNQWQSKSFNWLMRRSVDMQFHDLNCTFRAMKRAVLEEIVLYGDMYRFLPVIAHRQGFRVVEVPVRHIQEWGGAHIFGLGVYARRALDVLGMLFLAKFTLKPLRFFGVIGGIFLGLGLLLAGSITLIWLLHGGGLWNRPTFQLGMLLFVLGVQVIGVGLVGEIIIFTQARNLREYRIERIVEHGPQTERNQDA